jgi:hypothetical protein
MKTPVFICLGLVTLFGTATSGQRRNACDRSYPDFCIPSPPPDLDCPDVRGKKPFRVRQPDPHRFDRDHNGWGCEPPPRRH